MIKLNKKFEISETAAKKIAAELAKVNGKLALESRLTIEDIIGIINKIKAAKIGERYGGKSFFGTELNFSVVINGFDGHLAGAYKWGKDYAYAIIKKNENGVFLDFGRSSASGGSTTNKIVVEIRNIGGASQTMREIAEDWFLNKIK